MPAAVFLDRDGTINQDPGFVHRPDDLEFIPGAVEGLRLLKQAGFLLIVASNQSGVARGLYDEEHVVSFHEHMNRALASQGAAIDAFYFCPFHPAATVERYRRESPLRKPDIGMFTAACSDWSVDVARSYMVGDRLGDVDFARRAGLRPVLVRTGEGRKVVGDLSGVWVCADLREAAERISARHAGQTSA